MSKPKKVPELLFSLLSRGKDGEEPYTYSGGALEKARALISDLDGEQLKDVFRAAYVLDTKLGAPKAARALLLLGVEHGGGAHLFGGTAVPEGRVSEEIWRKVLGNERELPPAGKQKKTGKFPWELIGDPRDDEDS